MTNAAYTGAITATYDYLYDPVGNMTTFTTTMASTTVVTRTFNDANQIAISGDASGNTTYDYDSNGNLVKIDPPGASGTVQYGYDQRNLMITSTVDSVATADFDYDDISNRLRQIDYTGATSTTITYTNDILGLSQVLIANDGTEQVVNLFGHDLIHQDDGTEIRTLLADGLGSVRLEMTDSGLETATTYSPYGDALAQSGTSGTEYGFTGEQEDDSTGLLYLRARYYNPNTNRFLTPDTIVPDPADPQSANRYSYTLNNPVRFTDPTGHYVAEADDGDCKGSYEVCDNPEALPYLLVQGQTATAANVVENGETDDLTAMEYILTFSYSLTEGPAEYRLWQSLQYATAAFYRSDIPDFFGVPDYSYQRLTDARFGVSDFGWEFVGDVANTNQVQHFIGEAFVTVYATYFIGIPGDGPGGASVLGWAAVRYQDKPWDLSPEAVADRRLGDMAVDLMVNSIDSPSSYLEFLHQTVAALRSE